MTIAELIEVLEREPNKELPVAFAYPSGDHWKTEVVEEIKDIEELTVIHSDYHEKLAIPTEEELERVEDGKSHPEAKTVLILHSNLFSTGR